VNGKEIFKMRGFWGGNGLEGGVLSPSHFSISGGSALRYNSLERKSSQKRERNLKTKSDPQLKNPHWENLIEKNKPTNHM